MKVHWIIYWFVGALIAGRWFVWHLKGQLSPLEVALELADFLLYALSGWLLYDLSQRECDASAAIREFEELSAGE